MISNRIVKKRTKRNLPSLLMVGFLFDTELVLDGMKSPEEAPASLIRLVEKAWVMAISQELGIYLAYENHNQRSLLSIRKKRFRSPSFVLMETYSGQSRSFSVPIRGCGLLGLVLDFICIVSGIPLPLDSCLKTLSLGRSSPRVRVRPLLS